MTRSWRVHISALGCKLNQAEAESWARQLESRGHLVVARLEDADLHVVNSCAVTREAVRDSDRAIRLGRRQGLDTVLTGCAASGPLARRTTALGVERVIANADKDRLVELLDLPPFASFCSRSEPQTVNGGAPFLRPGRRVRVSLKVEDGCSMACAFCIIPSTRGAQRGRPAERVIAELVDLEARGYAEAVITGVQISAYRDGGRSLCDLVEGLLAATACIRLRLTSIAPWEIDERLFDLLKRPRVCRHVHLSLQSGCDTTLRRMRRPGRAASFADVVDRLRREVPGVAITSDLIVGFPGEDETEWRESLDFVRSVGFARLHVFPYSERPGTVGADLPGTVPLPVRQERAARMREVAAAGERAFVEQRVGAVEEVVWEGRRRGAWRGTTDNYLRVSLPLDQAEPAAPARGALGLVRIVGMAGTGRALAEAVPRACTPRCTAAAGPSSRLPSAVGPTLRGATTP